MTAALPRTGEHHRCGLAVVRPAPHRLAVLVAQRIPLCRRHCGLGLALRIPEHAVADGAGPICVVTIRSAGRLHGQSLGQRVRRFSGGHRFYLRVKRRIRKDGHIGLLALDLAGGSRSHSLLDIRRSRGLHQAAHAALRRTGAGCIVIRPDIAGDAPIVRPGSRKEQVFLLFLVHLRVKEIAASAARIVRSHTGMAACRGVFRDQIAVVVPFHRVGQRILRRRLISSTAAVSIIIPAGTAKPVGLPAIPLTGRGFCFHFPQIPVRHRYGACGALAACLGGNGERTGLAGSRRDRAALHGDICTVGAPGHRLAGRRRLHCGLQRLRTALGDGQLVRTQLYPGDLNRFTAAGNGKRTGCRTAFNILVFRVHALADPQRHINDRSIRCAFRDRKFQRHNCAIERNALASCNPRDCFRRNYILRFNRHTSPLRIHGKSSQGQQLRIVINFHTQYGDTRVVFHCHIHLHRIARIDRAFFRTQGQVHRTGSSPFCRQNRARYHRHKHQYYQQQG